MHARLSFALLFVVSLTAPLAAQDKLNTPPPGFTALFNGKDLTGWKGIPVKAAPTDKNPARVTALRMPERLAGPSPELEKAQQLGDKLARDHWTVKDGILVFDGKGQNLCTAKDYADFELYVDWKIAATCDSGIYLRGSPQVQIWDPSDPAQLRNGADKGSGALWNNKKNPRFPNVLADNPIGDWNTFLIKMVGEKVTIHLNGKLVVDNVTMENLWEPEKPIYSSGPIELQNHGNILNFRNIYIKELPKQG